MGQVASNGIHVEQKRVGLAFQCRGLPGEVQLTRGETRDVGRERIQFVGFRVPDAQAMKSSGHTTVFVDLQVTPPGGKAVMVAPALDVVVDEKAASSPPASPSS